MFSGHYIVTGNFQFWNQTTDLCFCWNGGGSRVQLQRNAQADDDRAAILSSEKCVAGTSSWPLSPFAAFSGRSKPSYIFRRALSPKAFLYHRRRDGEGIWVGCPSGFTAPSGFGVLAVRKCGCRSVCFLASVVITRQGSATSAQPGQGRSALMSSVTAHAGAFAPRLTTHPYLPCLSSSSWIAAPCSSVRMFAHPNGCCVQ